MFLHCWMFDYFIIHRSFVFRWQPGAAQFDLNVAYLYPHTQNHPYLPSGEALEGEIYLHRGDHRCAARQGSRKGRARPAQRKNLPLARNPTRTGGVK